MQLQEMRVHVLLYSALVGIFIFHWCVGTGCGFQSIQSHSCAVPWWCVCGGKMAVCVCCQGL